MSTKTGKPARRASFEFYQDGLREWRWRLLAANGRIIADSAVISAKTVATHAARAVFP